MEKHRTKAAWFFASITLSGLAAAAAHADDCNSNGVLDDVDLTLPVLRTTPLARFEAKLAWGQPLAADFNGDGSPDLTALDGEYGGYEYAVWMNRGGSFETPARYPTDTDARWAEAADLNGDGAADLAAVPRFNNTILLSLNDGSGRFSEPIRIQIGHYPRHIGRGDFDGDGRIDLVTASSQGVMVHWNGGEAGFEIHRAVGPAVFVERTAAADLDGDGDLDLALLAELGGEDIVLLANHGSATFDISAVLALDGDLEHAILEDLDLDGDSDLIAALVAPSPAGDGRLAVLTNNGNGVFGSEASHRYPKAPIYLAGGDADQDGDPDLLVTSEDLLLFRNGGGAGFSGPELLEQATTAGFFIVRDLDGSGAPEVWKARDYVPDSLGVLSLVMAPWSIDCDLDAIPDECGADCNRNRRADACDAADGPDCNQNQVPDECDADCNENNIADDCDLAAAMSEDCNGNRLPDECETADCNQNGRPDDCDVATGMSADCNQNLRPDECEEDCNSTGLPDDCDVARGTSPDENQNAIPDECEAAPSFLYDFDESSAGRETPGNKARLEVRSRIHILGLEPGVTGTQGWSLFAATTGCLPVSATTSGTVAAEATEDPPGLMMGGFRIMRLVPRRELEQIGLPQDGGYTSAVLLSLQQPVSLDPGGSPYLVARAVLEGTVPATGCAECLVEYVNWRNDEDGAGASGGLPGDNVVTFRGMTVYARRAGQTVRFCEAIFHRGDANGDGTNDISDAIAIFSYLFLGVVRLGCLEAANTDDSPVLDISDGIFLLTFLFRGGPVPPPPGAPSRGPCGPDPGGPPGHLGCERYDGCG